MAEIKLWTDGVEVEDDAMAQIRNVASLPIVGPHVAIMPDVDHTAYARELIALFDHATRKDQS